MYGSNSSVHSDVKTLSNGLREGVIPIPHAEVGTSELKIIVLVPVLEGQSSEHTSGIGKLQVGKVPVKDLSVPR